MKRRRRDEVFFQTGSTMLNLACSNQVNGGFMPGGMVNIVGDSSAGKSFLGLSILAEAAHNPVFDDHLLIYDDVEAGLFFDVSRLFGSKTKSRIKGPDGPLSSSKSVSIEEFYYHIDDLLKEGTPFVYILDSMDALTSEAEQEKFEKNKLAHSKGKESAGSFGDGKAKMNSSHLRHVIVQLEKTRSLLVIISQTRANIGISFAPKTRAGGKALNFYSNHEMWLAIVQKLKKHVRGKDRQIGTQTKVKVTKNRKTGRQCEVTFSIYYSYGLDDIGSCVDFLLEEKEWKKKAGYIVNDLFPGEKMSREQLIRHIEGSPESISLLKEKCGTVWKTILDACALNRRPKYE